MIKDDCLAETVCEQLHAKAVQLHSAGKLKLSAQCKDTLFSNSALAAVFSDIRICLANLVGVIDEGSQQYILLTNRLCNLPPCIWSVGLLP